MTTVLTGCRVGHDRWPTRCSLLRPRSMASSGRAEEASEVSGPRQHHRGSRGSDRFAAQDPRPQAGNRGTGRFRGAHLGHRKPTLRSDNQPLRGGKANRRGPSDRSNSRTEPGPMTSASGTGSTTSGTAPRSDCSAASRATARRRHARGRDRARHASIGDDELEPGHADLGSLADHRLQVIPFQQRLGDGEPMAGFPASGSTRDDPQRLPIEAAKDLLPIPSKRRSRHRHAAAEHG